MQDFSALSSVSRSLTLDQIHERYEKIRVISHTRSSLVRLARHIQTDKLVVMKTIYKMDLSSPRRVAALYNEITTLSTLQGKKNVVQLYDVIETNDHFCLVMEYAAGGELFDYVKRKAPLTESSAKSIFVPILKVVAFLHMNHIVHRDIKLENILLDDKGRLLLSDFGFARVYQESDGLLSSICGTAHYEPPEVLRGEKYNPYKTDSWALGVCLYVLIFNEFPFQMRSLTDTLQNIIKCDLKFPVGKTASPEVLDLLKKLLNKDADERLTAIDALAHEWCGIQSHAYASNKGQRVRKAALVALKRDESENMNPDETVAYLIMKRSFQMGDTKRAKEETAEKGIAGAPGTRHRPTLKMTGDRHHKIATPQATPRHVCPRSRIRPSTVAPSELASPKSAQAGVHSSLLRQMGPLKHDMGALVTKIKELLSQNPNVTILCQDASGLYLKIGESLLVMLTFDDATNISLMLVKGDNDEFEQFKHTFLAQYQATP